MKPSIKADRARYSKERLADLTKRVSKISGLKDFSKLSIYVTGSYGRHEASSHSDLDLFFIHNDLKANSRIDRLKKILIDAELIRIVQEMGFPDFSNDGQYLEIHSLKEILAALGGREDDFKNYFTARMLLLLESRPIYNPSEYDKIISAVVKSYFRDYDDHIKDFCPIFLMNDIIRFWRTLCLNYENKRNSLIDDEQKNNKNHLRNLKLKFSRLLTCFSTVIPLITMRKAAPLNIIELIKLPPLDRLKKIVKRDAKKQKIFNKIMLDYMWFLKTTARGDIEQWIGNKENRTKAFKRAHRFGNNMFLLLNQYKDSLSFRYIVL